MAAPSISGNVLVIGGNRGIGLALVQQLVKRAGVKVFATTRKDAPALAETGAAVIAGVDLAAPIAAAETIVKALGGEKLSVIIHNSGVLTASPLDGLTPEAFGKAYEVNALAPIVVAAELKAHLAAGGTYAFTSTIVASSAYDGSFGTAFYPYSMSKAALNNAAHFLALDLNKEGQTANVLLVHPGYVETDMTAGFPAEGKITTADSVAGYLKVIDELKDSPRVQFKGWDGSDIPL